MNLQNILKLLRCLVFGGMFLLVGCDHSVPKPAATADPFVQANGKIKAEWEKIVAAHISKDYATAMISCRKMQLQPGLTTEQLTSINDMIGTLNTEMSAAAQKGDQNAIKAIEEIRKNWR